MMEWNALQGHYQGLRNPFLHLTQVKLILSTEERKRIKNVTYRLYLCTESFPQTLKQYMIVHKYESARVSRSAAILFTGHSLIHLRYASSKHVWARLWSPWRAGNYIYKSRKYIIFFCNISCFIRLFIYLIYLTCPSVCVSILFINPSVRPYVCPSSYTKSVITRARRLNYMNWSQTRSPYSLRLF